ncbi:MAG: hypothetical protein NZM37_12475, partial [Sandaracinaceae bacterium]|nr:hypothetical protein [Sandaracinaceae bacterium]
MVAARLTIRHGNSSRSSWEIEHSQRGIRIVVGSDPRAGWVIQSPGVAPFHVEFYWDGQLLHVADASGIGDVRWNGSPVRGWIPLAHSGELAFGSALLGIEMAGMQGVGRAGRELALTSEPTRVYSGPAGSEEATRVGPGVDLAVQPQPHIPSHSPPSTKGESRFHERALFSDELRTEATRVVD